MRLQDVAEPVPVAGEVLVRVAASASCGSDMGLVRDGVPAIPPR